MSVHKVALDTVAQGLRRPFFMEHIARVDHFAAYLYICEGMVARHRHVTQDELFYVYRGLLSLETDWGRLTLAERELALVPRGLSHLSGSLARSLIILFQAQTDPEHKNGHGRLILERHTDSLPKWSVRQEMQHLPQPYLPVPLAQVDEMSLRLVWCQGDTAWHVHPEHDEMLLVEEGRLEVGSELGAITAVTNELLVIPRNRIHRLTSRQRTIALSLIHHEVGPEVHMGR